MAHKIADIATGYLIVGYSMDDSISMAVSECIAPDTPAWMIGRIAMRVYDILAETV